MRRGWFNQISAVWLLLIGLTILSVELSRHFITSGAAKAGTAAIVAIAFTKARIVGLEYMGLRSAYWPLRLLFESWIIGIGAAIMAIDLRS